MITNLVAVSLLIYLELNAGSFDWMLLTPYLLFVAFLAVRAWRLKRRVAELVDFAAQRAGLQRLAA